MKNESVRGWDVAAWVAASHLSVLLGSLLILALVWHGTIQTFTSYFAIGALVATPLALLARYIWFRSTAAALPLLPRIAVLAGGGAALGIPGAIMSAAILVVAGEDVTLVNVVIGGLVFGAAGCWCGVFIGPARMLLGRPATIVALVISTALLVAGALFAVFAAR